LKEVEFIIDYATKKKGDVAKYDGMLARNLLNLKVAKYHDKEIKKKAK
jgi:hypothetical protein